MKSKDLEIGKLHFEVIKEADINGYGFGIVLRVVNRSNDNQPIQFQGGNKTMLISYKYGMKNNHWFNPRQIEGDGYSIIAKSFVDVGISFQRGNDKFYDGDKIQIDIKNLCKIHIQRENSEWFFLEAENKQTICDTLLETVECFESLEESIGISIQNISINIKKDNVIDLFFEVLAIDDKCKANGFAIEYGIYDKSNKIRQYSNIKRYSGDFIGFEIYAFRNIELPMPAKEIGKIRIYPTKC